jgi:hypothetical protein
MEPTDDEVSEAIDRENGVDLASSLRWWCGECWLIDDECVCTKGGEAGTE